MANALREIMTGVWGGAPSGIHGQIPFRGLEGRSHLSPPKADNVADTERRGESGKFWIVWTSSVSRAEVYTITLCDVLHFTLD